MYYISSKLITGADGKQGIMPFLLKRITQEMF